MVTATHLESNYEPSDYFEGPLAISLTHGELSLDNGKAVYILNSPIDPVPQSLRKQVSEEVSGAFKLRQVLIGRPFKLSPPSVTQYGVNGVQGKTSYLCGVASQSFAGTADVVATDVDGNVKYDSRAERLKQHAEFIASLLPKMGNRTLRAMVDSYCHAMDDSANELVHLYEIRDAAREHFGNEVRARAALQISRDDFRDLRRLSNDEPLNQGRHRGIHAPNLRDATAEELEQARSIARRIIEAFAAVI